MNNSFFESKDFIQFFKYSPQSLVIRADAPRFTMIAASDQYLELSATKREDLIGRGVFEVFPDNDSDPSGALSARNAFERVIAEKRRVDLPVYKYDIKVPGYDDLQPFYWSNVNEPVFDEQGNVAFIINTTANITERILLQQREEAARLTLIRQQEHSQNMFMQAPIGMAMFSRNNYVIEYANEAICRMWNKGAPADVLGQPVFDLVPGLADNGLRMVYDHVVQTHEPYSSIATPVTYNKNGELATYYFDLHVGPVYDAENNVVALQAIANDVTDQIESRKAAAVSEARFGQLTNAMPQQVWTATPQGEVNYINQVIVDYKGECAETAIEKGWTTLVHPDDLPAAINNWQRALRTGETYLTEFRLKNFEGLYKWHLGRAVPIIENNEIVLWVGTNTDINEQKLNEQKKDEFLSIASHELKTPLTSIKAYNQLMTRMTDPEKVASLINKSATHIQRLERLINDLLDVTKINAGKIVYNFQELDFNELVTDAVESAQYTTTTHQIVVEGNCTGLIHGDKLRLEQVLSNFLSNAIKYSPQANRIVVSCDTKDGHLIIGVQDFGVGIAPENIDRLFERYYRVDNTAMRFEGLGLGLFIASEILKRHQGNFWIESEQGQGSTFYFRLPLLKHNEELAGTLKKNLYQDSSIRIEYQPKKKQLNVDWLGHQDFDSVKRGCYHMIDMVKRTNCHKILNDNTHVLGNWGEAATWVAEEFFPMLDAAGVKYLAWIYSPSMFSQLAAKKSVEMALGTVTTQLFDDINEADNWLVSKTN